MNGRHLALIVEDDDETADDLAEILKSIDCDSRIVNNKRQALESLADSAFCIVLLDLQIRAEPNAIKGHVEHGNSLLREIRQRHGAHPHLAYWLPVLIVSGFAREVGAAVAAMRDGAADIVHKPFDTRTVSEAIRGALQRSGRSTHDLCRECPAPSPSAAGQSMVLSIPGDRIRRRTRVMLGTRTVALPNSQLRLLLQLMVAHLEGKAVHKREMGACEEQGFKGISLLRGALSPLLDEGVDLIANDYHGFYQLAETVTIGACNVAGLIDIGDRTITDLARRLRQGASRPHGRRSKKSEGNPKKSEGKV